MRFPRGKVLSFARDPDPFEDVYALVAEGHSRKALKPLYKLLDAPSSHEAPEETDALLRRLDLERLDIKALVGVLTVTLHAHDKLPYRAELFEQIRERLRREAPDRVDALLEGLEA